MNKTPFVFDPTVPLADAPTDQTRKAPLQNVEAITSKAERTESLEGYSPEELQATLDLAGELSAAATAHILSWMERINEDAIGRIAMEV